MLCLVGPVFLGFLLDLEEYSGTGMTGFIARIWDIMANISTSTKQANSSVSPRPAGPSSRLNLSSPSLRTPKPMPTPRVSIPETSLSSTSRSTRLPSSEDVLTVPTVVYVSPAVPFDHHHSLQRGFKILTMD